MKYIEYQHNEKSLRSLTGLSTQEFRELLPYFEDFHDAYFFQYDMNGKYRNNRRGFVIYKNSPLATVEDRLFFILVYLKNNPLQEYHAACFEMDQKHCNSFIRVLTTARQTFDINCKLRPLTFAKRTLKTETNTR